MEWIANMEDPLLSGLYAAVILTVLSVSCLVIRSSSRWTNAAPDAQESK